MGLCSLLCCLVFYLSGICGREIERELEVKDLRRPIWNIAHMVNAIYQVDDFLSEGANSLEFDVTFDSEGTAEYTYHGIPCDCFRSCIQYEDFVTYLIHMRRLTTPGHPYYRKELVLLFMDVKVSGLSYEGKVLAGYDLAMKIIRHYWMRGQSGARAYILVSVPSIDSKAFVDSFRLTLKLEKFSHYNSKIGFDFSGNEDLDVTRSTYEYLNINDQIWQGDGITNCLPRGTSRLRRALWIRDRPGRTYINKVYWWTVDKMSTMRTTLRMGVDGLITNYPDRLISILKEEEFSGKLRLATYSDNPWKKFARRTANLMMDPQQARDGTNATDEDELLFNCDNA